MLLRYQDVSGRGPWRPGLSDQWVDSTRRFDLPPVQVDIPDFRPIVDAAFKRGLHIGCACRGVDSFNEWFTPGERVRLALLGFLVVDASGCEVLAETKWQAVFGSPHPLSDLPRVEKIAA